MKYGLFLFALIISSQYMVIGQNIVINEFCSLNATFLDEDKDSPDWLELYNSGNTVVDLKGYALTDDPTYLKKWIFPAINLNPQQTMLIFASEKDRKEVIYYNTLIKLGDIFSYDIGNASIPDEWKTNSFDDDSWLKGPSGFGFGDEDDATIVPNGTISVYVRKTFTIENLTQVKDLLLHVDYDDGFVAYINGIEIARQNMGEANTPVLYNQLAKKSVEPLMVNGKTPQLYNITDKINLLVEGDNILTIQVHNFSNTSSDLTLIPFLTVGYSTFQTGTSIAPELGLNNINMHTNFKIGADGEQIVLVSPQGQIIDKTDSIVLPSNRSYGRKPDGAESWYYFDEPTPEKLNTTQEYDSITAQQITFSHAGGIYDKSIGVTLTANLGDVIYYTTDGSEPTQQSTVFNQYILIEKNTSLRAKAFSTRTLSLSPSVQTYIIENRDIKLPIVSLSTDPYNLFDWNYGIYELGPNAEPNNPNFGANFWMDWERPINIEYIDTLGKKVFNSAGGIKIFGAWSRANAQKSFALHARNSYGSNTFNYPFFKERSIDEYHALVLRNSGNDWGQTVIRDAMMTGLVNELDLERQAYQPTVVYINGEYWGILNLREKINEDFLSGHHPEVDANKIDMLEANAVVIEGTSEHYETMINYIVANDMTKPEIYEEVKTRMEVINYMDYEITQIYFDNEDWPGNNIKYWRPQTEKGRWRWILFDTDFGFGIGYASLGSAGYNNNTLAFALDPNGPSWPNPEWSTFLLRSLVTNDEFRSEFINRFADRLNYDFATDRVIHNIDSLANNIAPEIPFHIDRWNHIWNWESNVKALKNFAIQRPLYMRTFIDEEFLLGGEVSLTVDVSDKTQGYVKVSSLSLKNYPWSGTYFKNNPVQVTAIPLPGYEFLNWEGIDSNKASVLLSIPAGGLQIKAVFQKSANEFNTIVINEIQYKTDTNYNTGDWVELFNTTDITMDLSNWTFKDSDSSRGYKIPNGTIIGPKKFLILCEDETRFSAVYPQVSNVVGPLNFGLNGTEDFLRLYDSQNYLVDSVLYMSDDPWPFIPENKGKTLSLINPYKNNEPYYRWEYSISIGTPGAQNDNFVTIEQSKYSKPTLVSCYPNPFSKSTTINWKCSQPEHIKVELFDFKGSELETIFEGNCPTGSFEAVWTPSNQIAPGLYYVRIGINKQEMKFLKLVKL